MVAASLVGAAGCGDDDTEGAAGESGGDGPSIVVTSTILGDIVGEVVGDAAAVTVLLPRGADPHEFAASTRQAEAMAEADLLVVNGAGFEAGLDDAIDAAADAGAPVFAFADHAELLSLDDHGDEHGDDEHDADDGGHSEDDGHDHEGDLDPHLWTDPTRLVPAVEALADALVDAGVDPSVRDRAADYVTALGELDTELEALLADIPTEDRVLVTNHEVLGYFADRYDFEVVGAVIPSLTTGAEASAADVDELAHVIEEEGVRAIFGETSSPSALAEALADAAGGDVEVVALYTESLGDEGSGAETYLEMMRTDARLIHDALT